MCQLAFLLWYPGMMGANGLGMELVEGNDGWEGNKEELNSCLLPGCQTVKCKLEGKLCKVYLGHFQKF